MRAWWPFVAVGLLGAALAVAEALGPVKLPPNVRTDSLQVGVLDAGAVRLRFLDAGVIHGADVIGDIFDTPASSGGFIRSHLASDNVGNDFDIFTENIRTAGTLLEVNNQFTPEFTVDYAGNGALSGGLSVYGTINETKSGVSTLYCSGVNYCSVAGSLPDGYDGHHGIWTVLNDHESRGGWLVQVSKSLPGNPTTANVFVVDFAGGITGAYSQTQEVQFPHCGGGEIINPDGGTIGILDGGYGNAYESALMYAVDKHRWCYCRPDIMDGGAPGTTGDGWVTAWGEQPCSGLPTEWTTCTLNGGTPAQCTATVTALAKCTGSTVGSTAAAAVPVAMSVSGTTLTVTAANGHTEVVNIHCDR